MGTAKGRLEAAEANAHNDAMAHDDPSKIPEHYTQLITLMRLPPHQRGVEVILAC